MLRSLNIDHDGVIRFQDVIEVSGQEKTVTGGVGDTSELLNIIDRCKVDLNSGTISWSRYTS